MKSNRKNKKVYKAYYDSVSNCAHPLINLRGKMLEKNGFNIGDKIEIIYTPNKIEIIKA